MIFTVDVYLARKYTRTFVFGDKLLEASSFPPLSYAGSKLDFQPFWEPGCQHPNGVWGRERELTKTAGSSCSKGG